MGKLVDILNAGGLRSEEFTQEWEQSEVAGEFRPLPAGEYLCHVERGELKNARTGTPEYTVTFRVIAGELTGRLLWHHVYLTPAAFPFAKRDLAKLGITSPEQLEQSLPAGIRCKLQVALRRDDRGGETNKVMQYQVIGIDEPALDAFAPDEETANGDSTGGNDDQS